MSGTVDATAPPRGLPRAPSGFRYVVGRRGVALIADDALEVLDAAGFTADGDTRALPRSDLSGRLPLDEVLDGERRLLVRRYAHGGLLRWLTGERFADRERPFDELCLAEALIARGVRTPRVVAARAVRASFGVGWRLSLISERAEGVRDLATCLERVRSGTSVASARQRWTVALGELLRELHGQGLEHVDLQLRNVLVSDDESRSDRPWILDLDRSRLHADLPESLRAAALARCIRSARRRDARGRPVLTRTDLARMLVAYGGREHWRDWLGRVEAVGRRRGWQHRLGWWLERRAGADPARRDGSARIDA